LNFFRCFYFRYGLYLCKKLKKTLIFLISLNHKNTTLKEREPFHFNDNEKKEFYKYIRKNIELNGLFTLSTCNRTDIYVDSINNNSNIIFRFISLVEKFKGSKFILNKLLIEQSFYNVIRHLFKTACGIESMVVGEYEIVDQIKNSFSFSTNENQLSPILNRLIQKSLECGKYVRTNTNINKGSISLSSILINKLSKFQDIKNKNILVVGAGKMSKFSIKHLKSKHIKNLFITNRSESQLKKISEQFNIEIIPFKNYIFRLPDMDYIIFLTSSKLPLISDNELESIKKSITKKIMFIDLSVPRNIKLKNKYEHIIDFNLDDLKIEINKNQDIRKNQIFLANKQIHSFVRKFEEWFNYYEEKHNYNNKNINSSFITNI